MIYTGRATLITSIKSATNQEWDYFVDTVESALYFQTREWFEIWVEYAGFEIATKLICFASGKKVLLPLARLKLAKGLLPVYFLAPKGFGGFVTNDDLDEVEKRELFRVLKKFAIVYGVANPYDALTNAFDKFDSEDFTQVLGLSADFDSLFEKWEWGHLRRARKGVFREGVTAELARTEDEWKSYFGLYQENLARWGNKTTNSYKWELFKGMHDKKSDKIKLWLAKYQGQIIAGSLCFYHNKHVAYWHSATSELFFRKINGTHALQYFVIKDACDNNYRLFDLLPSSGIEGVIEFKKGFHSEQKPVHIYMSPCMQLLSALRKRLQKSPTYRCIMKNTGF